MRKFMRTRSAAPAPLAPLPPPAQYPANGLNGHTKTNGHANGGPRRDDHSTLSRSRYWGGSGAGAELWEDPDFPASPRSIGERASGLTWRRPHELSSAPLFLGAEAEDAAWEVEVGALGSGALCAAAAALAPTPRLLARVAPPQSFRDHYRGAFTFRFWVFGTWREVAVDDRLPCRGGGGGGGVVPRLLSSTARQGDFTLPLLEKAYAKLYGSYAAMRAAGAAAAGEGTARALQELTGGIVQSFSLQRQPQPLTLQVLHSAAPRSTIIVATPSEKESTWRRRSGLASGQAYVVTGLARVRGGAALVRVRGRGAWRGAWARGSAEWRALTVVDRDALDARALHPDEFWMSFSDFACVFARLELVHVGPDDWMREPALHARRPWRAVLARRRWRRGFNAGGPPEATETTGTNPQFHVSIPGCAGAGKCHVVVSVLQQYCPRGRTRLKAVGFALYELPSGGTAPAPLVVAGLRALDVTHWSRAREVATFFTLPAGEYLLVPHTRRPHTEAAFLLRVLTDQHADIWEVNEDNLIVRSINAEFPDERQPIPPELRATLVKLFGKEEVEEVDATQLRGALRRSGLGRGLGAAVTGDVCRALVALRDARVAGRMRAADVPALARLLALWRGVWARHQRCGAVSAYRARDMLRQAGVHASNKVLEGCVVRFAPKAHLAADAFLLALARIHLAHERYRLLDTKLKSNPLSLEEMILMTIYS
ncbi:calpain-A-like isoform X2 [Cydia strobilella]|uniref:calpain-A-like isoform X2 n=1 Tax=Cydia strobilella TaxID=1100964 RepID=UPI00300525F5